MNQNKLIQQCSVTFQKTRVVSHNTVKSQNSHLPYIPKILKLKGKGYIQKMLVFDTKIIRRIFGPTKENQIWGIKTNEELDKLIKQKI